MNGSAFSAIARTVLARCFRKSSFTASEFPFAAARRAFRRISSTSGLVGFADSPKAGAITSCAFDFGFYRISTLDAVARAHQ